MMVRAGIDDAMSQDLAHDLVSTMRGSRAGMNSAASASAVNRTHRVVRERAKSMQERKRRVQSLWIPLTVCFGLMASILFALWNLLDESEFFPNGIPDASQQLMVISLWCLPLSVVVLVVVWFRLAGTKARNGSQR
jgi:hypothetical protein